MNFTSAQLDVFHTIMFYIFLKLYLPWKCKPHWWNRLSIDSKANEKFACCTAPEREWTAQNIEPTCPMRSLSEIWCQCNCAWYRYSNASECSALSFKLCALEHSDFHWRCRCENVIISSSSLKSFILFAVSERPCGNHQWKLFLKSANGAPKHISSWWSLPYKIISPTLRVRKSRNQTDSRSRIHTRTPRLVLFFVNEFG